MDDSTPPGPSGPPIIRVGFSSVTLTGSSLAVP